MKNHSNDKSPQKTLSGAECHQESGGGLEEERLKRGFSRIGVALLSSERKCQWVNDGFCNLAKYRREELAGMEWKSLIATGHDAQEDARDQALLLSGKLEASQSERQLLRKDGTSLPVFLTCHAIREDAGNVEKLLVLALDITERRKLEEARRELENQARRLENLGVISGSLVHDFNNTLQGIQGFSDLALADIPQHSPLREYLEAIQSSALRASRISAQMLAYSGKDAFQRANLQPEELAREIGAYFSASLPPEVSFREEIEENLPTISGSYAYLRHALLNLLTNALDAVMDKKNSSPSFARMHPVGVITLRLGMQGPDSDQSKQADLVDELPESVYVFLEVTDTGVGMPENEVKRIFATDFGGKDEDRGLGLAIVRNIVRNHAGFLQVISKAGKGTSVRMLFPALKAALVKSREIEKRPVSAVAAEAAHVPPREGAPMVLVVDDEDSVRATGKRVLERAGYRVLTARNGEEGLDIFNAHAREIAVVLLDYSMPKMDGEQTLKEMRRIRSDVRVIFTSGYSQMQIFERFEGALGFIQKPYPVSELVKEIKKALMGRTEKYETEENG